MRRLLSLTLALALIACGDDDSTSAPTNASVAGTWNLQTVNGSALPFTLSAASPKIELLSSSVNVTANGTWTSTTQTRTTIGTQATTASSTQSGTYTLSGSAVSIRSTDGTTVQAGTVSGNTLTLAQTGLTFVYQKQ
jgi:lipocalin-like protein